MNLHSLHQPTVDQIGDRVRLTTAYPDRALWGMTGTVKRIEHYIFVHLDEPVAGFGYEALATRDELLPV